MSTAHTSGRAVAERLAQGEPVGTVIDTADAAAWTGLDIELRAPAHRPEVPLPIRPRMAGGPIRGWSGRLPAVRRRTEPLGESELALALCHPDRRIREAALGRAAAFPALLPLVVIRGADWVTPCASGPGSCWQTRCPPPGPASARSPP
ncbi:hypothetical protein [Streptomyces sp. NPDC051219]|uniref:hypothetical protein n=1 Tax=Streptomyces sp. NPDC051219 TaxID=3155283 RepID=UPI003421533F